MASLQMAPSGFQIPSTGKNCAIVGCIYFAVLQQHLDRSSSGRRDRLADGFRSFGIGVVVMDRHDTPVPYGYFYATAMLQQAGEIAVAVVTRPTLFASFSNFAFR